MIPADYQLGEDVTDRFERPRTSPGMVVSFRLEKDEASEFLREAERLGLSVSEVAKLAIRSFLTKRE